MKKIYTLVAALAVAGNINAQVLIDFESFNLAGPEMADTGQSVSGEFVFNGVSFENYYNSGGWFNGFTVSNFTDVTTPGYLNQFSSFTGSGAANSAKYSVYYLPGAIQTNDPFVKINSFMLTNTTYAALSMRDGDGYGKQFGSIYDADGMIDGTNGEDFFRLWIIGESFDGSMVDSIEFFLGDYRFADSTQDYIVSDWVNIDLSVFNFDVAKLNFDFESSDNNTFGVKTPTYFALDNVEIETTGGTEETEAAMYSLSPNPVNDVLEIDGGIGALRILDATGKLILETTHNQHTELNFESLQSGVYFVTLLDKNGQRTQRLVK